MKAQWQNPRDLAERIYIEAELIFETPTHIGCGDTDSLLDMPLQRDPLTGRALLTGSTLAGAMRAYLVRLGESEAKTAGKLFGRVESGAGYESPLIVDDSIGEMPHVEIRDGVAIDPTTRTAAEKKKYDFELMQAGMKFHPCFELLVPQKGGDLLVQALADALHGLESGEIGLGKRTRRGFGRCTVMKWKIWRFPWDARGAMAWLNFDRTTTPPTSQSNSNIHRLLTGKPATRDNGGGQCTLVATFSLPSSLLIRSKVEHDESESKPDTIHLHNGKNEPIISGTSLAGALRGRALRILKTLHKKDAESIIARLFGDSPIAKKGQKTPPATASRVWVREAVIRQPLEMVHTRVSIDRFTGGAAENHLFTEQPVFGKTGTEVTLQVELEKAQNAEIGLLLLLLKDLWLGDLPIGGESSLGRGRLAGKSASLTFGSQTWVFENTPDGIHLSEGEVKPLQEFVRALNDLPGEVIDEN